MKSAIRSLFDRRYGAGRDGQPRHHLLRVLVAVALILGPLLAAGGPAPASSDIAWVERDGQGKVRVQLYFFWSKRCPHCLSALPFVSDLDQRPWVQVHSHEVTGSRDNVALYIAMAEALGQEAQSVPAFFACGRMLTGFDASGFMAQQILARLEHCRSLAVEEQAGEEVSAPRSAAAEDAVQVPILGELDPQRFSLPVFTLLIAGLDAFNPCAFFVLLFLLSLLVHARSRRRMVMIGGIFVAVSGLVYFLFMAAWLNLFLLLGTAPVVTTLAGIVAVVIGALNTRDYFAAEHRPTLAIPAGAKPALFRRMRGLLSAENMMAMLIGTIALALAANTYELLCTAGFPMVYTRVLTLNNLEPIGYYAYLALYNLVYVLPLLLIVAAFTVTLGSRKLSEGQGRLLKLLSGLMMFGLGSLLLAAPQTLSRIWAGAALLGGALLVTAFVALVKRWRRASAWASGTRDR